MVGAFARSLMGKSQNCSAENGERFCVGLISRLAVVPNIINRQSDTKVFRFCAAEALWAGLGD